MLELGFIVRYLRDLQQICMVCFVSNFNQFANAILKFLDESGRMSKSTTVSFGTNHWSHCGIVATVIELYSTYN